MNSIGAKIIILGLVQGVGYRHFCYRKATDLNLKGSVRNEPDGAVSVIVEGDRSSIESFIKSLKVGPSFSNVKDITVSWAEFSGKYESFGIES